MGRLPPTQATLLDRMRRHEDEEAWRLFDGLYRSFILGYARTRGCSDDMAWDVLQETMVALLSCMPEFEYRPDRGRFGSYLYGIVDRRVKEALRREAKLEKARNLPGGSRMLAHVPDQSEERHRFEWDRQFRRRVLQEALRRVRADVEDRTFEAFRRLVLEHEDVETVCRDLDLKANALYQIRHRLTSKLRDEAARIRRELGED